MLSADANVLVVVVVVVIASEEGIKGGGVDSWLMVGKCDFFEMVALVVAALVTYREAMADEVYYVHMLPANVALLTLKGGSFCLAEHRTEKMPICAGMGGMASRKAGRKGGREERS
ncbi:hypothetical protein E2C01_051300 [Portunus trituberculatus]|uniref:Uncharacterized protein n=1 Tax=Portunus trituberculatus TaxID=210409 RepID=A0A5B7GED7_PORTR|nr:hypothetical protein [Portunus trituberculatus]